MKDISDAEFQLIKASAAGFALALALLVQYLAPYKKDCTGLIANWKVNVPLAVLNIGLLAWLCGGCVAAVARWTELNNFGLTAVIGLPLMAKVIFGVLALDLATYAWHRANHRVPFLWRFHAVHHTDVFFDASTAVRFHPGEILISLPVRLTVIAAVGVPVIGVLTFEVMYLLANYLEHSNVTLAGRLERFIERVVVTPAIHRKHHSSKLNELNANYSTIFSFWDRMFGSYLRSSSGEAVVVGLPDDGQRQSGVIELLVRPLK